MSKQVCYDAMRFSRGGGFVARDMVPHGVRSPVHTVYRTIDSDITNGELVFLTTCGPTTTFDPKITGVAGTWVFDDGSTIAAASGVEISKTFATEGLHRAVFRAGPGGLAAITAIDCSSENVTTIKNIRRAKNCINFALQGNPALVMSLEDIPRSDPSSVNFNQDALITGNVSFISGVSTLFRCENSSITGALTDFTSNALQSLIIYSCPGIAATSIAHLTAIRDLRIYSMGWLTADVDTVIDSMWGARAAYTYVTPAIQIGGTNQAPTGNVTAPVEGADWHQDGATWIPLTAGAKAYDLAKDVNSEGFNKWTITYTGGSIAP